MQCFVAMIAKPRRILQGVALLLLLMSTVSVRPVREWFTPVHAIPPVITNILVTQITSTTAVVTWRTSPIATGCVFYGLAANTYGDPTPNPCPDPGDPDNLEANHAVALSGLAPARTYHFAVESTIPGPETFRSADRTFTTAPAGTVPPSIANLVVEGSDSDAHVRFTTDIPARSFVRYALASNNLELLNGWDDCTPGLCVEVPEGGFTTTHDILLQPLLSVTSYNYRIRATEPGGSFLTTARFTFQTADVGGDHIFTTGGCAYGGGTIPIGQCTPAPDNQYCQPGGTLVQSCLHCGYQCPVGQTCRQAGPFGVCEADPALTDSPTQCNRADCYDPQSGLFINNPAPAGCFLSWPRCDANTVLKVKLDRTCNKWLTCRTAEEVSNPATGEKENLCYGLTTCSQIGPDGQCARFIGDQHCTNDPMKFCERDSDCAAGALCTSTPTNITYRTPDDVDRIRNLSGMTVAGLDWYTEPPGDRLIEGYYHLAIAPERGTKEQVANGNFEDRTADGLYTESPWTKARGTEADPPKNVEDPERAAQFNRALQIFPTDAVNTGAKMLLTQSASATNKYFVSFRARSGAGIVGQKVDVRLDSSVSTVTLNSAPIELGANWKPFLVYSANQRDGAIGRTFLEIVRNSGPGNSYFLDDVQVTKVLEASSAPTYLPVSCRLYPREDAVACAYTDDQGSRYRGMTGYCLEKDPRNSALCLSWWPVDVDAPPGEIVGYNDRVPLYYCLESAGTFLNRGVVGNDDPYYVQRVRNGCASSIPRCGQHGSPGCPAGHVTTRDGKCEDFLAIADACGRRPGHAFQDSSDNTPIPPNELGTRRTAIAIRADHLTEPATFPASSAERKIHISQIASVEIFAHYAACASNDHDSECSGDTGPGFGRDVVVLITPETNFLQGTPNRLVACLPGIAAKGEPAGPELSTLTLEDCSTATPWNQSRYFEGYACDDSGGWGKGLRSRVNLLFDDFGFLQANEAQFAEPGSGYGFANYNINIRLKEYCAKTVKVVDDSGANAAWASRVKEGSSYVLPPGLSSRSLNYRQNQDLSPHGGGVVGAEGNPNDPTTWEEPLDAQARDLELGVPGQPRSGSPYACFGDCSAKVCIGGGNRNGYPCRTHQDCQQVSGAGFVEARGICQGIGQCSNSSQRCDEDSDCGGANVCIGGAASDRGIQRVFIRPPNGNRYYAQRQIQRLFVGSFGTWEWKGACQSDGARCSSHFDCTNPPNPVDANGQLTLVNPCLSMGYREFGQCYDQTITNEQLCGSNLPACPAGFPLCVTEWQGPDYRCKVCTGGGAQDGMACRAPNPDCGGNACDDATIRPAFNPSALANFNTVNADICGMRPNVFNYQLNDGRQEVNLGVNGGYIFLKFNTTADADQLPLQRIRIDWGDGTERLDEAEPFAPKSDLTKPHVFRHIYQQCLGLGSPGWNGTRCEFKPRVLVEDNWGWCNNGIDGVANNPFSGPCPPQACSNDSTQACSTDNDCTAPNTCRLWDQPGNNLLVIVEERAS